MKRRDSETRGPVFIKDSATSCDACGAEAHNMQRVNGDKLCPSCANRYK